ncbi:MAG: hypothetical protein NTV97_05670 [Alphaproteobacteria bacterium]|nr:hypothetical protein [Alphaproteobacteria bacterium]
MAEESKKPASPTGAEFLKAFEESRKEALQYHETLWKIALAGIGMGSAVVGFAFAPRAKDSVAPVTSDLLFALTGATVLVIGAATVILIHLYWYKYQTTIHFGNAFRHGWLGSRSASWVGARLSRVWLEAQRDLKLALHRSVAWAAPGWLMMVAGLILIVLGR